MIRAIVSGHEIRNIVDEDFDLRETNEDNVQLVFRLRLPFRLRVGQFHVESFVYNNRNYRIALRNQVLIPQGEPTFKIGSPALQLEKIVTDALVICENPRIDNDTLDSIRRWNPDEGWLDFGISKEASNAKDALNRFLVAYSTVTKQMIGATPIILFGKYDFMDSVTLSVGFIGPVERMPEDIINNILDLGADKRVTFGDHISLDLDDLAGETIDIIQDAIQLQDEFIHLEMAFKAKAKVIAGDMMEAILLMVAALEGAHSAVVQHEFEKRMETELASELAEKYLRELGTTLCMDLTPYLLLDETERPPSTLVTDCKFGLKVRNDIMHALKNRSGDYRLRIRTEADLSRAFKGARMMYECYSTAMNRRLEEQGKGIVEK